MEELKYIVSELNKNFDTDYNMISFDSLSVTELLQVVVNVLNLVNATTKFDVANNKDQAVMNILNALQTIKYTPETDVDAADFREGLIMGKRNIIHPILYWVLANSEKVKKRVYFASYVEKVDLPIEIMGEPEVEQMNNNYEKLIDEFWISYNGNKNENKNAAESTELQEDTKKMAVDMSHLLQRLDMQNDKLKNIPNRESLLASVKAYRREVKQEEKLQGQLKEHKNLLMTFTNEMKSLQSTLNQTSSRRPENLDPIQQVTEEFQINKILAESQLPMELQDALTELEAFEKVAMESEPTQEDMDNINKEIEKTGQIRQALLNKKITLTNTNDDQLLPFRNQAMMISNKKQELSNFIMKIKEKNESVLDGINQKAMTLREIVGGDVLHGDELKVFIANLRDRSIVYKKYREYMQGLQAELGIASRTMEILKLSDPSIDGALKTRPENPTAEVNNDLDIDDIVGLKFKCRGLYQEANAKRSECAGIYEEFTAMRTSFNELTDQFDESKGEFDTATGNLTDQLDDMEKQFEEYEDNIKKGESDWRDVSTDIEKYDLIITKYSDSLASSLGASSILEQLGDRVTELEKSKKSLEIRRVEMEQLKNVEQDELEQLKRIKQMVLFKVQGAH